MFAEQRKEVLKNLKKSKGYVKAKDEDEAWRLWVFGSKTWQKRFKDVGADFFKAAISTNGERVLEQLPVMGISFDVLDPNVVAWVDDNAATYSFEVTDTTIKALRKEFKDAITEGETIPKITERVNKVFDFAEKYRARNIARTETNGAANYGAQEAYTQSGLVIEKEWLPTLDDRVRDDHAAMADVSVGNEDLFELPDGSMAMYPGDPRLPVGQRINCRCTTVGKVIE